MKRKQINVALPFYQMKRGDMMYISTESVAICPSEKKDVGLLYIHKNPKLSPIQKEGFLPIVKIGDGFYSKDFDVIYSGLNFYYVYPYKLDESKWLKPVEVQLNVITPFNMEDYVRYDEYSLQELVNVFEGLLQVVNLEFSEDSIKQIFNVLPDVAKAEFSMYDLEMLYRRKEAIDYTASRLDNSKRGVLAKKFYGKIKKNLLETIAVMQEKNPQKKTILQIKDLQERTYNSSDNEKEMNRYLDSYLKNYPRKILNKKPKKGGG